MNWWSRQITSVHYCLIIVRVIQRVRLAQNGYLAGLFILLLLIGASHGQEPSQNNPIWKASPTKLDKQDTPLLRVLPSPDPLKVSQVQNQGQQQANQREIDQFVDRRVDASTTLDITKDRPTLLLLKQQPKRVEVADDKIADFRLITPKELSLIGKTIGTTVLTLWFADPKNPMKDRIFSYVLRVLPNPEVQRLQLLQLQQQLELEEQAYKRLEARINCSFPDSRVHLELINDKLLVKGQAHDIAQATQILRMLGVDTSTPPLIPVDQLILNVNAEEQQQPSANAQPSKLSKDRVQDFLTINSPVGRPLQVINLLQVPGEHQVLLRVTVAEVNRTAARSIGINFSIFNNQGINVFSQLTGQIGSGGAGGGAGGGQVGGTGTGGATGGFNFNTLNNLPTILDNGQIIAAVNALKNLNFARSLAEPTLVAVQGKTATFQAGGQFPVPVVTGFTASGLQGVSFIPFGVQLAFTPTITDKDRIRLNVAAEVSTRDPSSSANINGTNVSGLNTRKFDTIVELREGQTLAVAGLIQNNFGTDTTRVPLLGEIPFAGRFFGFDRTSAGEQELIVLITPELVRPIDKKMAPPIPGADLFEPSDLEFYLLGRLESRRPYDFRSPVMNDLARMKRYYHCEELFIYGPQGYETDLHK